MALVEKTIKEYLPPLLDYLESQVSGPFLVGSSLTLADIAISCPFVNLQLAERPLDAARWPKLAGYVSGILARPAAKISDPQ